MRTVLAILVGLSLTIPAGCDDSSTEPTPDPRLNVTWATLHAGPDTVSVRMVAAIENWSSGYGLRCLVEYVTAQGSSSTPLEGLYMQSEFTATLVCEGIGPAEIWFPYSVELRGPPFATVTVQSRSGTYRP